jgi:hydroxymethylglutaryl-CoA lyase
MMSYPTRVQLTEVGMRDGFQMEPLVLPTERKRDIGLALISAGVRRIEATSFVSPRSLPQLADAAELVAELKGHGARLTALVPNVEGARRAAAAGVDCMTVFVSASESHNRKNVRRSIAESLAGLRGIRDVANGSGVVLGGAIATAFGCPYEGNVTTAAVVRVAEGLAEMGAEEICLGDTTGMATPPIVDAVVAQIRARLPGMPISLHFHNTRGLGLVNVMRGLDLGIDRYDAAIGGLGGCPFAVGATGNICSEDLVYMLNELGIPTGIDLPQLIAVAHSVQSVFGRELPGQIMKAGPRLADTDRLQCRPDA